MMEGLAQTQNVEVNGILERNRFTNTVRALSQQFYQSVLVDNPGTYLVISNSLLKSVPVIDFVTDGDLAIARGLNRREIETEIIERINALPIAQVQEGQKALDELIDTASVVTFSTAHRLKPYLPITLPDTREGLRVLKEISLKVRKQIAAKSDREKLAENLSSLEKALRLLEDE